VAEPREVAGTVVGVAGPEVEPLLLAPFSTPCLGTTEGSWHGCSRWLAGLKFLLDSHLYLFLSLPGVGKGGGVGGRQGALTETCLHPAKVESMSGHSMFVPFYF
jgi:hypothetical protein